MASITLFNAKRPLPLEHRRNFIHLYFDIAWFGVLSGSSIAFMAVFATRLGASALQIGLLNAAPAVINLLVTLPAGKWLQHRRMSRAVFWTAVAQRLAYAGWALLPFWLAPQMQIWTLIMLVMLMSIPGTALAVGFNALFAASVPSEWRAQVAGTRNALLAVCFIGASLLSGYLLDVLPFPVGYQVVFTIGFIGAAMSSLHLWFVRPVQESAARRQTGEALGDLAHPGMVRARLGQLRTSVGLRHLTRARKRPLLRSKVLSSAFGPVIAALFAFHLAQYLAIPLFPLYWVNTLHLTDTEISLGNTAFYVMVLLGSTQLARLSNWLGHKWVVVIGVVGMSSYPLLTALTQDLTLFLITSLVGGLAWALVGGAISNYLNLAQISDSSITSQERSKGIDERRR